MNVGKAFGIKEIEKFFMEIVPNQHAKAYLVGMATDFGAYDQWKNTKEDMLVKVYTGENILFAGYVKTAECCFENRIHHIILELVSTTEGMDRVRKSKSFQDVSASYKEIIEDCVSEEQAGFEASFLMGTNALTVSTIPDIVTAGGMTLLATDGAYALNEINTMCTGQNLAVDTVFEGNEENYEACVVALQVLNDGLLDLTTRGYQRNGSGSSSSEAEKSDEGAEISESGVNIRGAGDESGGKTFKFSDMTESEIVKIVERYRKKAPIEIPDTAKYKAKSMADGYEQISYKWNDGTYKYEVRWHTRTSGAPEGQGNTWVIQRTIPGNGGKKPSTQFLIGENEWVEGWKWYDAISARKNGTATQEQIELLDKGHWKE